MKQTRAISEGEPGRTVSSGVEPRPGPARPRPRPRSAGYLVKRLLLGRPLPTARLAHERLGKPTALAVFASDNLSSVAYATEEILKVAVPVVGIAAFGLVMPITFAMLAVLAILLFSYRQTIRAYPNAGGAYLVTRDNFGLMPAQVAGVALLTDYVLTVAVSVSAGVAAITSAVPGLHAYRVWMAVAFVAVIAFGNLRGVRESGRIFAMPTYFFIGMMFLLLGVGLVRALSGDLHSAPPPTDVVATTGAVSLFLVLKAFASGGAAVTGVEAISNGIPAFRRPEWRNARTTLMWMGSLLGVMFLGLSFLAVRLQVLPSESQTVISQVGRGIFGAGALGTGLFYALQVATTLILVLAANTAFADFPRLASFQAGDEFMPRQLTKRGHRLVFSNGVVGLGLAAIGLIVIFGADVHRLIPLYAVGVFASFTFSQAGMARRHLRLREQGWRPGLLINGLGAVTTAVVTVVIAVTKFAGGAWAIMVFVPIAVALLVRLNRRYDQEREVLEEDLEAYTKAPAHPSTALVLVEGLDRQTLHALQYARTIRPRRTQALYLETEDRPVGGLRQQWVALGLEIPLRVVKCSADTAGCLAGYVGALPDETDVTVIIPAPATPGWWERLRRRREEARLARALAPYGRARLTVVRDHPGPGHPVTRSAEGPERVRLVPRAHHKAVVLVDRVDRAALEAVRYALSLNPLDVWAVHAGVDPEYEQKLIQTWMDLRVPVPLDIIECFDRDVARAIESYVVELSAPDSEVTVVLPRRDHAAFRHRLLHDRTSRRITSAVGGYPHVDVAVVPYFLSANNPHRHSLEEVEPTPVPARRA